MKVYQANGKFPVREIEHLKFLLGDLWRGYHAYEPDYPEQDATIVLAVLSEEEIKENGQQVRAGIKPNLLKQRWQQIQAILQEAGYEVESYG